MDTASTGESSAGSGSVTGEEGLQPREINELSVWRTGEDSGTGGS